MSAMDYATDRIDFVGCDALRSFLIANGFACAEDTLGRDRECNWYAYRRVRIDARECECNDGKPVQIVAKPFAHWSAENLYETVEFHITGECRSAWFDIKMYSMSAAEFMERISEVEQMLVRAWNALAATS